MMRIAGLEIRLQIRPQIGIAPTARVTGQRRVVGPAIAITASVTRLVNVLLYQLQNGRAKVPDFLRLSINFVECYAPTSDHS